MKLTLEHIYFRDVFKNLTFAFETGKMTLLIGDTGAGKSTLFRILTNFNELDFSGEVKLGDTLLSHLPIHKRVTYLSMMFQNPSRQFTMPTLYEELIFTLENLQTPAEQIEKKIPPKRIAKRAKRITSRKLHFSNIKKLLLTEQMRSFGTTK